MDVALSKARGRAGADGRAAQARRLLAVSLALRDRLARAGASASAQVVDDPFLLGYVFGAIAGACEWTGRSACEVDAAMGLAKMGLMKVAFEEALGGPELVLDAVLRTWRWESEPAFVLGQRLGREASVGGRDSFAPLSPWLADAQSRPAHGRRIYC